MPGWVRSPWAALTLAQLGDTVCPANPCLPFGPACTPCARHLSRPIPGIAHIPPEFVGFFAVEVLTRPWRSQGGIGQCRRSRPFFVRCFSLRRSTRLGTALFPAQIARASQTG